MSRRGPQGAVVLAAGGARRYLGHHHKLLAPLQGRPVVRWVLEAVARSGLSPIIVVTGAVDLWGVLAKPLPGNPEVVVVDNPGWQAGMATSLQVAIDTARTRGLEAVVVGLGDQPGVPSSAWRSVADAPAPLAVATYGGERRNPVRIHAEFWNHLPNDGDEGARSLVRQRSDLVAEVACEGSADDIDTVEDVAHWRVPLADQGEDA